MLARQALLCGGTLLLASCAAVPLPPEYDNISVEQIVDTVQCELAAIYRENPKFAPAVRDWVANVVLTLKVVNEVAAKPTVTITPLLTPVITAGTLTVVVGPDFDDQSQRIAEIQFDIHMRDLDPKTHRGGPRKMPACGRGYTGLPQAANGLGLREWVNTIAVAAGRSDFASLTGAVYDLKFFISRGLHGGFVFEGTRIKVDATGATASTDRDNHLLVTFADDPKPKQAEGGKSRTSPEARGKLDAQKYRFLPQRFILQSGTGRLTQ
jgi:hypothetical protein